MERKGASAAPEIVALVHRSANFQRRLRPRADALGLQWFAKLEIVPVSVILYLHDPLLGQQELVRPLLPALKLLDWSLG